MTLGSYPTWPFEPNWQSSVGESLSWLTDVLASPSGAEQRRTLRYSPRRGINFSVLADGDERAMLDNMLITHGASDWYLPIWYDATISNAASTVTAIPCVPTAALSVGRAVFIKGTTVFDWQIAEISVSAPTGIEVTPALARAVPAGTLIYPMTVARLVEQPTFGAMSDGVEGCEGQFLVTEAAVESSPDYSLAGLSAIYRGFRVLARELDWASNFERSQQRLLDTLDVEFAVPVQVDTASRPFPRQRHSWVLNGLADHASFYALLNVLRGRAVPVWVPTWMSDLRLRSHSIATITVEPCGYSLAGGPRPEREDVMIETVSGSRYYRRITASVADSAGIETLLLDSSIGESLTPASVVRVSFMSLMRLDQDSVEIQHLTDLQGTSEVEVTFRAAPDLRVVTAGF